MLKIDIHCSEICGSGLTALHHSIIFVRFQLSAWSLILLTSERVISVWFPFKCKELCSRRRIISVWIVIFVALFALNSHFFVTFELIPVPPETNNTEYTYVCSYLEDYRHFWLKQWYWISAAFISFIPFGFLFIGNISIVSRIVVANRLRKGQMQAAGAKNEKAKGGKVNK